jgi:hypothetical protein
MNLPLLTETPRLVLRLKRRQGRLRCHSPRYDGRPAPFSLVGFDHHGLDGLGRRGCLTHGDPHGHLLLGSLGPRAGLLLCDLRRLKNMNRGGSTL